LCHQNNIRVTSTSFSNSIALAVALSGFPHHSFVFEGFLTNKSDLRQKELKRILKEKRMSILMDTPYRLSKILSELEQKETKRDIFLGMDLNCDTEELLRGSIGNIIKTVGKQKREFILIIGPEGVV
jgi:16S rRNA (cytidine1402-2'-O)-methyltransferase